MRVISATNKFRSAASGAETPLGLSSDSEDSDGFHSCESDGEDGHSTRRHHESGKKAAAQHGGRHGDVAGDMSRLSVK